MGIRGYKTGKTTHRPACGSGLVKALAGALCLLLLTGCSGKEAEAVSFIAKQAVFEIECGEPVSMDPASYLDGDEESLKDVRLVCTKLKDKYGTDVNSQKQLVFHAPYTQAEPGDYPFRAVYVKGDTSREVTFTLRIREQEKPVITRTSDGVIEVAAGTVIDWSAYFTVKPEKEGYQWTSAPLILTDRNGEYETEVSATLPDGPSSEPVKVKVRVTGGSVQQPDAERDGDETDYGDRTVQGITGHDTDGDGQISDEEYLTDAEIEDGPVGEENGIPKDHRIRYENLDEAIKAGDQWVDDHWGHYNVQYEQENGKTVYWLYLTRAKR